MVCAANTIRNRSVEFFESGRFQFVVGPQFLSGCMISSCQEVRYALLVTYRSRQAFPVQ